MATNPLKILTYLTASKDAKFEESVNIVGAGTALTVANTASIGELNVVGNAIVNGDLTVKGQYTYVESTVVTVGDTNLNLGTGSDNLATLDSGGIDLGTNAVVQWRYDNANTAWTSNKNVNLKTDAESYKISGSQVLTKTGTTLEVGAGVSTVVITAPLELTGALQLSGSSQFTYITTPLNVDSLYNVDDAIHALDIAVSGAVTASAGGVGGIKSAYDALRLVITGTLDGSGQDIIDLTTPGGALNFSSAQSASIALDIMVGTGVGGALTNDLVAIRLEDVGGNLTVQIDAPATPNVGYRLIAVNEKVGGLG